ncbi:MAG: 50S ribosomal protein L13 [Atribacterota bacterium]
MNSYKEKKEDLDRNWYLIDANEKILGRLATKIATILRGKNRINFENSVDLGNYVIVVNAEKVRITGKKEEQKLYRSHSQYPGALKEVIYKEMKTKKPDFIIKHAVKGMLPNNRLSRKLLKRLKVYSGDQHPHIAHNIEISN